MDRIGAKHSHSVHGVHVCRFRSLQHPFPRLRDVACYALTVVVHPSEVVLRLWHSPLPGGEAAPFDGDTESLLFRVDHGEPVLCLRMASPCGGVEVPLCSFSIVEPEIGDLATGEFGPRTAGVNRSSAPTLI